MKKWLNNYFGFTKKEFNGLLVLIFFIIVFAMFPYVYSFFQFSKDEKIGEVEAIQKLALVPDDKYKKYESFEEEPPKEATKVQLFMFDPNLIGMEDWKKLGLSEKQAKSILNYRNKGGKFRKPEDLKKMYAINQYTYQKLFPYIQIQQQNTTTLSAQNDFKNQNLIKKEPEIIEINSADTTQLDKIKGIGMAFANRIIKYRERLGGFYKKEQLMEVYGLDSLKYLEIKDQISVDKSKIKMIDVNAATFEMLKNNPYLRFKQINALIEYRKQHGAYKQINDLNQVKILSPQTINNLAPYLYFN